MKRKILIIALALLLCVSLCACGSTRTDKVYDKQTANDGMDRRDAELMPDAGDGYVADNNAGDGFLDENLTTPTPNMTK